MMRLAARSALVLAASCVLIGLPVLTPAPAHAQGFNIHFYFGSPPPPPAYGPYGPPNYESTDWYYYCRDAYWHRDWYAMRQCRSYYYWHGYGY
jgi:hypothetical protein